MVENHDDHPELLQEVMSKSVGGISAQTCHRFGIRPLDDNEMMLLLRHRALRTAHSDD